MTRKILHSFVILCVLCGMTLLQSAAAAPEESAVNSASEKRQSLPDQKEIDAIIKKVRAQVDRGVGYKGPSLRFEGAGPFNEGLAAVKLNGKWGYIDKRGQIVIEPRFVEEPSRFLLGLAMVKEKDKFGVMDKRGRFVIAPQYASMTGVRTSQGTAYIVSDGALDESRCGLYDDQGQEILPMRYRSIGINGKDSFDARRGDLLTVLHLKNGSRFTVRAVAPLRFVYADLLVDAARPEDTLYSVYAYDSRVKGEHESHVRSKQFLYDGLGRRRGPADCDKLYDASEGRIVFGAQGKYGVMDTHGRVIVEAKYDGVIGPGLCSEGRIAMRKGDKFGYVDASGKEALPFIYEGADGFFGGKAVVAYQKSDAAAVGGEGKNFRFAVIDRAGQEAFSTPYDAIARSYSRDAGQKMKYQKGVNPQPGFVVMKDGRQGFLDENGKELIPPAYDLVTPILTAQGQLFSVMQGRNSYVIDSQSNAVAPKEIYYAISHLSDAMTLQNGAVAYVVDKEGVAKLTGGYYVTASFHEGYATIKGRDAFGYVDRKGRVMPWSVAQ